MYAPYTKPNNHLQYVHRDSNHPPIVIKNIPKGVNRRLTAISSSCAVFNEAIPPYKEALIKSKHSHELEFNERPDHTNHRKRRRNITWFNPPFSKNVATDIGRKFLQTIKREFHRDHALHRIFNKNTTKISYSCMNNIKGIIQGHNNKILNKEKAQEHPKKCNCRLPADCPLKGECLRESIIYQATVASEGNHIETYIGLTENTFKKRYGNHKCSFNIRDKRSSTELSKYVWELKDKGKDFNITWKVVADAKAYTSGSRRCGLCITEKYFIIFQPHMATLNDRRELVTTCRHRNKHLLSNCKA